MKKLFFLLLVFSASLLSAQEAPAGMVPIEVSEKVQRVDPSTIYSDHESINPILDEFFDGVKYAKGDHVKALHKIRAVFFVDANLNWIAGVTEDGTQIHLNSELLKYPNLTRVILLRQFGNILDLPESKKVGHDIMGKHWVIDERHEYFAAQLRSRPWQRKAFFDAIEEKHAPRTKL